MSKSSCCVREMIKLFGIINTFVRIRVVVVMLRLRIDGLKSIETGRGSAFHIKSSYLFHALRSNNRLVADETYRAIQDTLALTIIAFTSHTAPTYIPKIVYQIYTS